MTVTDSSLQARRARHTNFVIVSLSPPPKKVVVSPSKV